MADSSHDRLSGVKDRSWQKKWLAVPAHPKFRLKLLRNGSLYSDAILINLFDLLSASEHMIIKIIQLYSIVQATTQGTCK